MVQVFIRAISVIVWVETTETVDGTMSAMQIEGHDEQEVSVRRDVKCRRKVAERSLRNEYVVFGRVLPDRTERAAVRN